MFSDFTWKEIILLLEMVRGLAPPTYLPLPLSPFSLRPWISVQTFVFWTCNGQRTNIRILDLQWP